MQSVFRLQSFAIPGRCCVNREVPVTDALTSSNSRLTTRFSKDTYPRGMNVTCNFYQPIYDSNFYSDSLDSRCLRQSHI